MLFWKNKIFWKVFYAERIIRKNKVFRVDNRSVFYKLYNENGIVYVLDLIFESDNKQSYGLYRQKQGGLEGLPIMLCV